MYVFHHHYSGVHKDTDGNSQTSKGHKIGSDPKNTHENESEKHRKRQDRSYCEGSPQIAEQNYENEEHQNYRLAQCLLNSPDRVVYQFGAIIKWDDPDSLR